MSGDLKQWLSYGKKLLKSAGIDSYSIDAEILLSDVLNFSKVQLFTKDDYILTEKEEKEYKEVLYKRKNFMPVQYIRGKCEFMGLPFIVNPSTLIPRCDTEILVESAINTINKNHYKTALDIGTGSGAIAVSLSVYCPNIKITAADISSDALKVACENAEKNNVSDKINFVLSDVFENINSKYDIIISNPPYIKSDIISSLISQVKDYEPVLALDGGTDGLYFYRKIIKECKSFLNKGGSLFFEIGYDQSEKVSDLLNTNGFTNIKTEKDLAGLDRVVSCIGGSFTYAK